MDCSPPGSSSMGFSRQEHWSGLPCPPLGDLPIPWMETASPLSPALAGGFITTNATWEALHGAIVLMLKIENHVGVSSVVLIPSQWEFDPFLFSRVLCAQSLSRVQLFATPWTIPNRLLCPWDSPGKNIVVGCHALLQGVFPTQELNPGLLHCRWILYCLNHQGLCYFQFCTV